LAVLVPTIVLTVELAILDPTFCEELSIRMVFNKNPAKEIIVARDIRCVKNIAGTHI